MATREKDFLSCDAFKPIKGRRNMPINLNHYTAIQLLWVNDKLEAMEGCSTKDIDAAPPEANEYPAIKFLSRQVQVTYHVTWAFESELERNIVFQWIVKEKTQEIPYPRQ